MDCNADYDTSEALNGNNGEMHALSLSIIRSVVMGLGGTVTENPLTKTLDIDVPAGQGKICAKQIEQQVDAICYCMYMELTALAEGNLVGGLNMN